MSKSLGNFYTLRDLIQKGYTGMQVRYLLLQVHYRTQLNFTFEALSGAASALERLSDFVRRLQALRKEKMQTALHQILDFALPSTVKKQVSERIFFDVQHEEDRDILDAEKMRPLIERGLQMASVNKDVAETILREMRVQRQKAMLSPILKEALAQTPQIDQALSMILSDVKDRQQMDILDPEAMQPILQRALFGASESVSKVLHQMKVKRSQGFVLPLLATAWEAFTSALADDLNISLALSSLFEMVREVNSLCDQGQIGISEAEDVLDLLKRFDAVMGVIPLHTQEDPLSADLEELLHKREEARHAKEWKRADALRDQLLAQGYLIEDTPQGARLKQRRDYGKKIND